MADAARLHPRSLEWQLEEEGTSIEAIRDDVRFAIAKELLALTRLPVGEISSTLSFGSHSSFLHAFQRWAGTRPTNWRREHGASRPG